MKTVTWIIFNPFETYFIFILKIVVTGFIRVKSGKNVAQKPYVSGLAIDHH